ncbi:MAG: hypothetical protein ACM3TR_09805 [Caulobacteraceae bacterium]
MGDNILPSVPYGVSLPQLAEIVGKISKELSWLLNNLDSMNVTRLNTNETEIKSENGETYINGPLIQQYDSQVSPMLRLELGYKESYGDYVFNMYDKLGTQTIGIDSSTGRAVFRGDITSDAVITGATIRSAPVGYNRIELSNGKFMGINSNGDITGLYFEVNSSGLSDLYLYHSNVPMVEFYDEIYGYRIRGTSNSMGLTIGGNDAPTFFEGVCNFLLADVTGLIADTAGGHAHGGITGTTSGTGLPAHSHTITADTGHTHTIISG